MRDSRQLLRRVGALGARASLAAALAAAFLAAASPAAAATLVVNTTTDQAINGCPSSCSLRDAVAQSNAGDTIMIPAGHYVLLGQAIDIPHGLTLVGDDARTTVLEVSFAGISIFRIHLAGAETVSISGLSLVNVAGLSAIEATGTQGSLGLLAVTIANNINDSGSSNGKGGGVYAHDLAALLVNSCTFSNNFALQGGGIYAENIAFALIFDSTFFGNSADSGGSAIQAVSVTNFPGLGLSGDTLTANSSSPALAVNLVAGFSVANTIVAGNPGGGCSITNVLLGASSTNDLDGDGSCGFTDPGSLTGVNPHLGSLANNGGPTDTAALLAGSPAIDAGDDDSCLLTDQRGVSRPQGPHCDMGAYEAQVPPPNCAGAVASPNLLWPPNNKMVPIHINGVTNPSGGAVTLTVTSIFQDEPVAGSPDGTGVGTSSPAVRAERDGGGDGRVYHISFTATNSAGGSCTGSVTVGVPHDQGKHGTPVDGGSLYNSTVP